MRSILALLLVLCLSIGAVSAFEKQFQKVTCGSTVKLANKENGYRLHSHEVTYGSGSGQQSITGYHSGADTNSYWVIKGAHGQVCKRGEPIACNSEIRLQHTNTKKFLHSHLHRSPISGAQEVSGYLPGDSGDNWVVICPGGKSEVHREEHFRLKHKDTGLFLSSKRAHQFGNPIQGQLEVAAVRTASGDDTLWAAQEGIFLNDITV